MDYALCGAFVALLASVPLMFWRIYRQAAVLGAASATLTPDDRLRVALAKRLLEDARRELEKASTLHPDVALLVARTTSTEDLAQTLLRKS